jgi:hypothetical protein
VDPHQLDADLDSTYHPDGDPDSNFILFVSGFLFDADPDPTCHPDPDPDLDPEPSFLIKVETLEKMLK